MLKLLNIQVILISLMSLSFALPAQAQSEAQRQQNFNVAAENLALSGYDPVSYQQGNPKAGNHDYASTYKGILYHFSSQQNQDTFEGNPEKYEPACGGWCAWAMLDGEKVEVDPQKYLIIEGKLYLFFDGFLADTRNKWLKKKDNLGQAKTVARQWAQFIPSK